MLNQFARSIRCAPALVIVFLMAAAHAANADSVADSVAGLSPSVEALQYLGTWTTEEGESGTYRLIVARQGSDGHRLFIQWLPDGSDVVKSSTEIVDFSNLGVEILDIRHEIDGQGLALYVEGQASGRDAEDLYEIFVFGPEDIRVDTATN